MTAIQDRVPPSWGVALTVSDYATLEASWITRAIVDAAMLRRVDEYEGREIVGQKGKRDCAGLLIPYYWPGEPRAFNYRLRRDNLDWTQDKNGKVKPDRKYLSPPNGGNRLFIPPGISAEQLADLQIPVALVEGEKKGLALSRLAWYETDTARFVPIALPGVWNWRGKIGKANGPKGERVDVRGPISDLGRIRWMGRKVFIIFDSNVHTNDSVNWARKGIAHELSSRGASVDFIDLPEDCGVNGIDDLLAAWGPARVLELFEKPTSGSRLHVVVPPQFRSEPDGMFRITTKGEQLSRVQLTNFSARITTNVRLDDGIESKLEFEIESELLSRHFRFIIPASEFASMEWPIERMGSTAITFPNQRDYARTAIQSLSMTAEDRCIYTHTGWRKVDGRWLFLHGGGAICGTGLVTGVNVRLMGALSRYELRPPPAADGLVPAVMASLRLVGLGPPSISFPLLAATYRAVIGEADFSLHLAGETGAFKSELAALHQQHFGVTMNRLHLPGAWASTGNALEVQAFHAKDALFVIDDFAPQGSSADIARSHAAAERVFRAAGNHAGRGRLDASARLREQKPPRALILSTGEDIPRGHSVRARLLILELSKGAINANKLTECQRDAEAGLYMEAMAAFLQWMAARHDEVRERFEQRSSQHRAMAPRDLFHARTPEIIANLQAAFENFLEFAEQCSAIDGQLRESLTHRCWNSLCEAGATQSKHQASAEPTERFLSLVRSCLSSGRAHLEGRAGGVPDQFPEDCGWRRDGTGRWSPGGDSIGWVDGRDIYLEPTTAYRVVQLIGRDTGEGFSISEQILKKRLKEKKLLASSDEKRNTITVRRRLGGSSKDVLHIPRSTLLPVEAEDEGSTDGDA